MVQFLKIIQIGVAISLNVFLVPCVMLRGSLTSTVSYRAHFFCLLPQGILGNRWSR